MIELIVFSFVAGILTILAPCILPVLPVILGGSVATGEAKSNRSLAGPIIIITSLIASIIVFTLLLKATTGLLGIPTVVWSTISGIIISLFGINLLFPSLWEKFMITSGLTTLTSRLMGSSSNKSTVLKNITMGAALGPIFNSCSPTYALIVAAVLPQNFATGLVYLLAYSIGLGLILLLIAIFGRSLVTKLKWAVNPNGIFQKIVGCLFLIVGIGILLGLDKQLQTYILSTGLYDPIANLEESFRRN